MESDQTEILRRSWEQAAEFLKANPDVVTTHAPGLSLEQISETVRAYLHWLDLSRSPKGFKPVFHVVHFTLRRAVQALINVCDQIPGSHASAFPGFLSTLAHSFAPLSALYLYSDEPEQGATKLAAELQQALEVLRTAEGEMTSKMTALEKTGEVASRVEEAASTILELKEITETRSVEMDEALGLANSSVEAIAALKDKVEAEYQKLKEANSEVSTKNAILGSALEKVQSTQEEADRQQKLINDLLEGATSAGLASAFNTGKTGYKWALRGWAAAFITSILLLAAGGTYLLVLTKEVVLAAEVWRLFAMRLPMFLPLIWLGWFSAMQFGNVLRIREDYAFKEATARAFAGYRDHMEHLARVETGTGQRAIEQLAVATIVNLSSNPVRLLGGQVEDSSPWFKLLTRKQQRTSEGEGSDDA